MLRRKKKSGEQDIYEDPASGKQAAAESDVVEDRYSADETGENENAAHVEISPLKAEETEPDPEGKSCKNTDETGEKESRDELMDAFETWLEASVDDDVARREAMSAMSLVCGAIHDGRPDESVFEVIAKGAAYDRAVREAEMNGEVSGRNARIDELMADEYGDDGVPHPCRSGGSLTDRSASIFDIAREAY